MALNPSNSSNLEQLALKGLMLLHNKLGEARRRDYISGTETPNALRG